MICEDAYYYFAHRISHLRPFNRFHKIHHRFNINVCIASDYLHPVDFFLISLPSVSLGPMILGKGMHFYTWLLYFAFRTIDGIESHCGYDFPWSPVKVLPLQNPASFHDYHHSANIGNYSAWFCHWDIIFGTTGSYFNKKFEKSEEEKDKGIL